MANYYELLGMITEGAYQKYGEYLADHYKDKKRTRSDHRAVIDARNAKQDTGFGVRGAKQDLDVALNELKNAEDDANKSKFHKLADKISGRTKMARDDVKDAEERLDFSREEAKERKAEWMAKHSGPSREKSEVTKKLDAKLHRESVDELKLDIYESCYNGEISEEERDTLLSLMG